MTPSQPGWLPISVRGGPAGGEVWWAEVAAARWDQHAFFDEVVRAHIARAGSAGIVRTPLRQLLDSTEPGMPAGLIFHLSRSGSTLLTRMLARLRRHRVLSEPDPLDDVLRADIPDALRTQLVGAVLGALARRSGPADGPCFVKLDPWHVLALSTIRRACPEVPWIFLYRDPLEVVVSHNARFGIQVSDPGLASVLARYSVDLVGLPPLAATYRYLQAIAEHAANGIDAMGRLVEYRELPEALPDVLGHFGLDYPLPELNTMLAAAGADAQRPSQSFVPDGEFKRAAATPQARAIAGELAGAYERLERLHARGAPRSARSRGDAAVAPRARDREGE